MKPIIVCLCGSTRFMKAFNEANLRLTLEGKIVLSVGAAAPSDSELGLDEKTKAMLDELHKRKIDIADEVLILNVGGYIGASTKGELEYAKTHHKIIRFLEGCILCGQEVLYESEYEANHPAPHIHETCIEEAEEMSRYADTMVCPYCGEDNGTCDDEIHHDGDEHNIQCSECERYFWAFSVVDFSYRIEKDDRNK